MRSSFLRGLAVRFFSVVSLIGALPSGALVLAAEPAATPLPRYIPTADELRAAPPQRFGLVPGRIYKDRISPHWLPGNSRFWYRNDLRHDMGRTGKEFILVDAEKATRQAAFDHQKLAASLTKAAGKEYAADRLPFDEIQFVDDGKAVQFKVDDKHWKCDLESYECSATTPVAQEPAQERRPNNPPRPGNQRGDRRPGAGGRGGDTARSPDGKWTAFLKESNVYIRAEDGTETQLSTDGKPEYAYGMLQWSGDSKSVVAFRIEPGENKEVYRIESSPRGGGRAKLQTQAYALPGDKFTAYELNLFDLAEKKQTKPPVDRIDFGRPSLRWNADGHTFTYQKTDRGHQRFRLIEVDAHNGNARNIIDEQTETFIWTAHSENLGISMVTWLERSEEIIYVSERDGWRHMYLVDANPPQPPLDPHPQVGTRRVPQEGSVEIKNQITKGQWVVRGVERIDEENRQIWFRASGMNAGQDPYFIHYYRINFDGSGLVALTAGDGTHSIQYSPDRKYIIDTYSRVDTPPAHELRRVEDGKLIYELERADISELAERGWQAPEVFSAKGRDDNTDIWGIICRLKNFDPAKRYPVIEQIYAGPQGSYVPKSFSASRRFSSLTDLGFIVVQIDGMGTANRSKAFHDICWKNLKDAGLPDRVLWHKAVAAKYPQYDIERVGVYGGSAGGQNSTGAVLFHGDFYKAAVSGCGCHDNRMDKASWNEQWMGYPVGPQYAESSNIDNAHRLQGKLLLIVGELDNNVPPESTFRLADALIKANKDFELVVVPGAGHGMGGTHGDRKLRNFFIKHVHGVEPPDRNAPRGQEVGAKGEGQNRAERVTAAAGPENTPASTTPAKEEPVNLEPLDLAELNANSELRGVIERYQADRGSVQRSAGMATPARRQQMKDFHQQWLDRLATLDFDTLGHGEQVDYLLFKNYLQHEIRELELRGKTDDEVAPFIPFAQTIYDLDEARRQLEKMDWSKVAATLHGLAKQIGDARRAIESSDSAARPKRTLASRAAAQVDGLRSTLRAWHGFYSGYDPLFNWWNDEPYKAAEAALQSYGDFLRQRFVGAGQGRSLGGEIIGSSIGREALLSELAYEMISYTPEELLAIAEQELAWCEAEMKKATDELQLEDWRAAVEHVKNQHVEPGQQPELIRQLALEAIDFVERHELVTVPPLCAESWRMAMMSPERQLVNPFFTGGETITVSYPTSGMAHEAKLMSMRGNNIHFARATVHHELIPGHHLQGYMTARHHTYREPFRTAFWTEGWALYWEMLLYEMDFPRSPENRVGMLFWRMHRCARIIFSLKFHLGEMTPQECIDFLVNRVGHERDNATAEVRRSFETSYGPLYQAAYMLGGLQFRAMHEELVKSGKMTNRQFHDAILKQNNIPVEMVRAILTKQPLTRDFQSGWRFYGEVEAESKANGR